MTLTVERYQGSAEEWDAFVCGAPGWTHFHRYGWRSVIDTVFGHECPFMAARTEDGNLAGVLPLVRVKSWLFGHYLVSMPFVSYGGPVGADEAVRALARAAVDLADRDGAKLLELRSARELPLDLPVSHRKITVVLDIPGGGAEELWSGFRAKLRSQIRRPEKEGVEVRFGPDQTDGFFQVFRHQMRDLGTPTQPKKLFNTIADVFAESVWFGCAYYRGKPVACGAGFRWADEFEMTWASALKRVSRIAPNMLLYWSFMKRCAESGVRRFNFGRCTPGAGTHRFKQQWGSTDVPLWWYQFSREGASGTPSPGDGGFSLGPRLWKRLPVSVATAVGPRIVRYIP